MGQPECDIRIGRTGLTKCSAPGLWEAEEASIFFHISVGGGMGNQCPRVPMPQYMCTAVRRWPLGVDFLHPLCEFQAPNSGCQAWWQMP